MKKNSNNMNFGGPSNYVHQSDNTQFMNIGRPIDAAVLEIPSPSAVRTVQALTIFIWPVLALACGGVAWWVRRT